MMTLKEFGEKLEELNQAYSALKRKCKKPKTGEIIEVGRYCRLFLPGSLCGMAQSCIDRQQ